MHKKGMTLSLIHPDKGTRSPYVPEALEHNVAAICSVTARASMFSTFGMLLP
jgi:hypothetical protein